MIDGRMIAFCLAIPGLKPGGKPYLHSHMLGVLPEYRNAGIGRQLKLRQRDDALARGIDLIEWTFDPLEIKNAYFNVERLGAIVRRYVRNQYGTTSAALCTAGCRRTGWWRSGGSGSRVTDERRMWSGGVDLPLHAEIRRKIRRARARFSRNGGQFEGRFARGWR